MFKRFEGDAGKRIRLDSLKRLRMVSGNSELANEMDGRIELIEYRAGDRLIEQGGYDNDVYFILAGTVSICVNGKVVATRHAGDHVGEMAALEPTQPRSATVISDDVTVVAKINEADLAELGQRYPEIYMTLAKELSKRLLQRNNLIGAAREKIRVFIISSVEGLPIARKVQAAFEHDPFLVTVWTDGVFRVAGYALASLEEAVDESDFAIAIAHEDDVTRSRGKQWPAPRDNVVFELGMFVGRLGRERAILMEPRDVDVKLPSDLAGVTTVPYRFEAGKDASALLAPACDKLRDHIRRLGPNV